MRTFQFQVAAFFLTIKRLFFVAATLAIALPVAAQEEAKKARERWIKQYGATSLEDRFYKKLPPDGRSEAVVDKIKVVVTKVVGDTDNEKSVNSFPSGSWSGSRISADWHVNHFSHSSHGSRGGGGSRVPEDERDRLGTLLANLPAEANMLPPTGRRVLIQVAQGDHYVSRIYDLANAPDDVLEILRLTESQIRAWLPTFKSQYEWQVGNSGEGIFNLAPDGKSIIAQDRCQPIKFWNPHTKQQIKELPFGKWHCPTTVVFSPDKKFAVFAGFSRCAVFSAETWDDLRTFEETTIGNSSFVLHSPIFTPDCKFLLLQNGQPSLQVFSTKNWQRCDPPDYFPTGALAYFPAPKSPRAVIQSSRKSVALWDTDQKREYATLGENAAIRAVAFSSDESLVAVATMANDWRGRSLRIWNVRTGMLVHELRPYERRTGLISGVLWAPDDSYLLGLSNSDDSYGIGIWNASTGRHRGQLLGAGLANGFALFDDARKVAAGCRDGKVRVWDLESVQREIVEFEKSLVDANPNN